MQPEGAHHSSASISRPFKPSESSGQFPARQIRRQEVSDVSGVGEPQIASGA